VRLAVKDLFTMRAMDCLKAIMVRIHR
jgi:hypothetical protein